MAKKKGKKDKKKDKVNMVPNILTEVDRTFYELHIADLNKKINRLNELIDNMKMEQEQCEDTFKQAEDEKTDEIHLLSATLKERDQEIRDINESMVLLDETEEEEIKEHEKKLVELDETYERVRRELIAETKELEGILNSLEEFAEQQPNLEKKYEEQEALLEQREIDHQAEMEEIERKFQIVKQKLKRGMEAKLLQLSTEFQEKAEAQMPATTHRMVRENVAIHNELDLLLVAEHKLDEENEKLKKENEDLLSGFEAHESNRMYLLEQTKFQSLIIHQLRKKYEDLRDNIQSIFDSQRYEEFHDLVTQIVQQQITYHQLLYHNNILKKNWHGLKCRKDRLQLSCSELAEKNEMLQYILIEAVCAIEEAIGPNKNIAGREALLQHLLQVLTTVELPIAKKDSVDSVATIRYKNVEVEEAEEVQFLKHAVHITRHTAEVQTTKSIEALPMYEELMEIEGSATSVHPVVVQEEESEAEMSSTWSTKFYDDLESSHSSVQDSTEPTEEDDDKESEKVATVDETIGEEEEEEELGEEESERILLEIIAEQESLRSSIKSSKSVKSEQSVNEFE